MTEDLLCPQDLNTYPFISDSSSQVSHKFRQLSLKYYYIYSNSEVVLATFTLILFARFHALKLFAVLHAVSILALLMNLLEKVT